MSSSKQTTTTTTTIQEYEGPFLLTATFLKRFAVVMTIVLSVAGLILSAIASLHPGSAQVQRRLIISGIVINAISISLSALTSLDWKKKKTNDRAFAARLLRIAEAQLEADGRIVISAKDLKGLKAS